MSAPAASSSAASSVIPWSALARLIRLPNQTGTYLLLLPSLWALVLAAGGIPPLKLLLVFIGGSFLMRSAGVIMNDLADQGFDRQVTRTKTRPLASGALSRRQAYILLGLLLVAAAGLLLTLPPLVAWLSPIAVGLAALYPFSKRWIHIPQAMLGIAFGWGTIMAWAAVREQIDSSAWLLFGATVLWAIAYDTIYAVQDLEDDRRVGVKSAALYLGASLHRGVGLALASMLALLAIAGWLNQLQWPYYFLLAAVGGFFMTQVRHLQQPVTPAEAFAMFRNHMWAGIAILLGLLAGLSA
ncbi:MAG: 4-hydroxybenzoate octaprenyltransferase [Nitrospira sp.]|nr:4-hydroxybenzoate octaprenyltransferase [Nitrospira sp.]MDH5192167.1 4-hydroxybenzoate octaprenyltransferase [Nitrospira sp.]